MKNKKGFTLMEVLVYIAVLIVVTLTATNLLFWMNKINNRTKASRETINNVRKAISTLSYEIREAKSVYASTSLFADDNGRLSLETTKSLPSGESRTYVDFYLCENRLCIKREEQLPQALTSDKINIESLRFSNVFEGSSPSVEIVLTASYGLIARPEDYYLITTTSTVALRTY